MSRRGIAIIAFAIAIVLTAAGLEEVWLYKSVPRERIAVWFPLLLIFQLPEEFSRFVVCLIQFPLLAVAFCFGIQRWRFVTALCVVLFSYALCVAIAFALK
jgi:hypothetical protein